MSGGGARALPGPGPPVEGRAASGLGLEADPGHTSDDSFDDFCVDATAGPRLVRPAPAPAAPPGPLGGFLFSVPAVLGGPLGAASTPLTFGISTYGECFVTDEDLERARRKLAEEETLSEAQRVYEASRRLDPWRTSADSQELSSSNCGVGEGVMMFCQNTWIACGELNVHPRVSLFWTPWSRPDSTAESCDTAFSFPVGDLQDWRLKSLPDDFPTIMATLPQNIFVQWAFPKDKHHVALRLYDLVLAAKQNETPLGTLENPLHPPGSTGAQPPLPKSVGSHSSSSRGGLVTAAGVLEDHEALQTKFDLLRLDVELAREAELEAVRVKYQSMLCALDATQEDEEALLAQETPSGRLSWEPNGATPGPTSLVAVDHLTPAPLAAVPRTRFSPRLTAAPPPTEPPIRAAPATCDLCCAIPVQVTFLPCRHQTCEPCWKALCRSREERDAEAAQSGKGTPLRTLHCPWDRLRVESLSAIPLESAKGIGD